VFSKRLFFQLSISSARHSGIELFSFCVCVVCFFFNVVAASYLLLNEAICLLSLCCEALKHFRFIFSSLEKLFFHCRTARKLGVVAGVRRWKGRKVAYRSYSLGLKWLGFFGTSSAAQVVLSGWAAQR